MHRALAALVLVYATFSWVVVQVYWRIKKSSKTKAKLYKAWLANKTTETEIKYKNYKRIFKSLALECEAIYYREMFDKKNNSVRQIWKNLNIVCSFKGSNATKSISKLLSNGIEISNAQDICSEFNHYFSTVGESLIKKFFTGTLHKCY